MIPAQRERLLQPRDIEGLAGAHQAHHVVFFAHIRKDGTETVRREHEFRVDLIHTELHTVPAGQPEQRVQLLFGPAAADRIVRAAHQEYAHAGTEYRLQLVEIDLVPAVAAAHQRDARGDAPIQFDRGRKQPVDRRQDRDPLPGLGIAADKQFKPRHHAGQHQRVFLPERHLVPPVEKTEHRPDIRVRRHRIAVAWVLGTAFERFANGRRAAEIHVRHPQRNSVFCDGFTLIPLHAVRSAAVDPAVKKSTVKCHSTTSSQIRVRMQRTGRIPFTTINYALCLFPYASALPLLFTHFRIQYPFLRSTSSTEPNSVSRYLFALSAPCCLRMTK